jgi:hypothetical protein
MYGKTTHILFFLLLAIAPVFVSAQDEAPANGSDHIRQKDKSFSTFIVLDGLIQNTRLGVENNTYYVLSNFSGFMPIASLRYMPNRKHAFGLRFGMNNHSESFTHSDSIFNNNFISTSKTGRTIRLNPSYIGFMTDEVSTASRSMTFVPFYEYHFKGNRRWDYYVGAEYLFDILCTPKSKNAETLVYTNNNNDRIEYTLTGDKSMMLQSHGLIATAGVNFFMYKWLSFGTKLSMSRQVSYINNFPFTEKLLVNGVDRTSDLNIPNTSQFDNFKVVNTAFLGGVSGGFFSTFSLPIMINFYF